MKKLADWSVGRLLGCYVAGALIVTTAGAPFVNHALLGPEELHQISETRDELYWMPEQLQLAMERLDGESARFSLGESSPDSLKQRFDTVQSKLNVMNEKSEAAQTLLVLPQYRDIMTEVADFVRASRPHVLSPTPQDMRALREGIKELRPDLIAMTAKAHEFEHNQREVRRQEIRANRRSLLVALLGAWTAMLVSGWLLVWRMRAQTVELTKNLNLLQAERLAREAVLKAEEARNTFLGKVSHEINSPLQAILTNIQLMEGRVGEDSALKRILSRLQTSVSHLRAQVNDLLDVSEVKSGVMKLKITPTDLAQVVHDVISVHQAAAESKGLYLTSQVQGLGIIRADGRRLAQVMTNLIANSIRYTQRGGIHVDARMYEDETGQPQWKLVVTDTGIGFSPDVLENLYQPFMQAVKHRGGTGLGLAIVKGLVDHMNGQIQLDSREGHGTTFTVVVPVTPADPAECAALDKQAGRPGSAPQVAGDAATAEGDVDEAERARPHVMLVEDDPDIQETVGEFLEERGFRVQTAGSKREALKQLHARTYAAIILDMELGDGTGVEVAQAAKKTVNLFTPLICCTAYPELLKLEGAEVFDAKLSKPVDASRLVEVVTQLRDRATAA
jgi:signal transduction histidine kinase/ActR/RegA family two-component response regulator